ncbi:MAG TPA: patatin-like phospholipase family protein [Bacteriovoracaceae bacterium]|nr:patatin-like phospholipase family protein [Bacteriovoracaceae bacterium]
MSVDLNDIKNKKIALVLSGGVVKAAAWHLGVTLALEELGFYFKSNKNSSPGHELNQKTLEIGTYVGSSAGAMICVYLAAGYSPHDVIQATLGIKGSKLQGISYKDMFAIKRPDLRAPKSDLYYPLDGFPTLVKNLLKPILSLPGLFTTEGARNYLLKHVIDKDSFEDFAADLFIVATQLDHSRKVIFSKYNYPNPSHDSTSVYYTGTNVSSAIAATMSVPPFYCPYPIKNKFTGGVDYYIDGEIRETLSTHVAEDNGCDVIISSWTHTPYHFHDEVGSLVNYGLAPIAIQSIYLMIQKKIISSRAERAKAIDIIDTVNDYMKSEKFTAAHRREIMAILQRKMNINPKVKLIDIFPDHHDYKLFFANSFSLNSKVSAHAVEAGYKRTMQMLSPK